MANWLDVIALVATLSVVAGFAYVVIMITRGVEKGVENAKEGLKAQGLHISDKGVSIKTDKSLNREAYLDATQKGIVKAVGAASFGKSQTSFHGPNDSKSHLSSPPSISREESTSSNSSKKSLFGKKKKQ